MQLEIDISDKGQLRKAKAELERLLGIVNFALNEGRPAMDAPAVNGHPRTEPQIAPPVVDQSLAELIGSLGDQFTTTHVISRVGKDRRSFAKNAIARAIEARMVRMLKAGKGRRPSVYVKLPHH